MPNTTNPHEEALVGRCKRIRRCGTPWICLVARWLVGAVFAWSGLVKIANIDTFALSITAYELLPIWGVAFVAYVLPPVEMVLGTALLLGTKPRLCAGAAAILFLGFIVALAQAEARGLAISCGCFGTSGATGGTSEAGAAVMRDIVGCLSMGFVAWADKRPRLALRAKAPQPPTHS